MHTLTCKYMYYCNIGSTLVLAICYLCIHALYMQNYYKQKKKKHLVSSAMVQYVGLLPVDRVVVFPRMHPTAKFSRGYDIVCQGVPSASINKTTEVERYYQYILFVLWNLTVIKTGRSHSNNHQLGTRLQRRSDRVDFH